MRFGIVDRKSVLEKALGKTVTPDNITRTLAPYRCELHFPVLHLHQAQVGHAGKDPRGKLFRNDRQLSCRS